MTTEELVTYYADLLIIQYSNKPKAYAEVKAWVRPAIMDQLPLEVRDAFNVDTAVGVQLDLLGQKYAGVNRLVNTYTSGTVLLDDTDYRLLVRMKLALNNLGSSLADIQQLIFDFFMNVLLVFDYRNMRLSYLFNSTFGSREVAEAFAILGLLPKPMGVQLASLIYVGNISNVFGFRTYDLPAVKVKGFNTYDVYNEDWPWISYADAIPT